MTGISHKYQVTIREACLQLARYTLKQLEWTILTFPQVVANWLFAAMQHAWYNFNQVTLANLEKLLFPSEISLRAASTW